MAEKTQLKDLKEFETKQPEIENHIYTVYDEVTERQGPIFEAANHAHAIRSISEILHRAPTDMKLLHVGYRIKPKGITAIAPKEVQWLKDEEPEQSQNASYPTRS